MAGSSGMSGCSRYYPALVLFWTNCSTRGRLLLYSCNSWSFVHQPQGRNCGNPGTKKFEIEKKHKFALMMPKQDASDYCGGLCCWWSKSWHDMCKTYQVTHLLFPNLHFWSWAGHRDTNPELDSAGSYAYLLFELGQVGQVVHMFDSNYLDELH